MLVVDSHHDEGFQTVEQAKAPHSCEHPTCHRQLFTCDSRMVYYSARSAGEHE